MDCEHLMDQASGSFAEGAKTIRIPYATDPAPCGKEVEVLCTADGWTVFQSRGQHGNPQVSIN